LGPHRNHREEVTLAVLRTADHLRCVIGHALQPFGLTLQQYNVLRILRGTGGRGLPTLSIAECMIERTPGITRLLDRIEQQGWVRRERCQKDRRVVYAQITDSGRELLDAIEKALQHLTDATMPVFDEQETAHILQLLARLRQVTSIPSISANRNHAECP